MILFESFAQKSDNKHNSFYSSKKYPAGFLRALVILTKVFKDGKDAPVS